MDENKVTKDTSTEEHGHHHHHHHHHHSDEHRSSRRKKHSRKHRGFYTVSNNVLLAWVVVLTIAILVLVAKLVDMNEMISRLAEYHDLALGETIIQPDPPISVDDIV